jgi:primosomal protein N' (replication factor Y) (superfamily II helicase)
MAISPILRIALPVALHRYFDYLLPVALSDHAALALRQGVRVLVPFRSRQIVGFLVEVSETTAVPLEKLKNAITLLDTAPLLPDKLLTLLHWVSRYYHAPLGEVLATAFPALLRRADVKDKISRKRKSNGLSESGASSTVDLLLESTELPSIPHLNREQQDAVDAIIQGWNQFKVYLLQGVTGSGKTEVYLRLIDYALQLKQQVLFLVPEISLTPQTVSRLTTRFNVPLAIFHSGLTEQQRLADWHRARTEKAAIVVGTRSAVFIPLQTPGLIIIDEEHDSAFKQEGGIAYHARDLAIMRAKIANHPILLGSATPAFETLWNADCNRYQRFFLSKRAGNAVLPRIQLLDVRAQKLTAGLSSGLLTKIQQHLTARGQVLLFLNRRGFAPLYLCHACGWIAPCKHCDSPLRLHQNPSSLRCHHCGDCQKLMEICEGCQQAQLFDLGHGTQKLEKILTAYFPGIACFRLDTDSTRKKQRLTTLLKQVQAGEPCIVIGTQILAKGHHFPAVTLVAIIDADAGLFGSGFRSLEHSGQLIIQVAGRAGRAILPGEVVVQTHHPHHPLLNQLVQAGYESFSQLALQERQRAGWPPFSHLALLRAASRHPNQAMDFLHQIKQQLSNLAISTAINPLIGSYSRPVANPPPLKLLGPIPALMEKRAGYYRAQLLFQAHKREILHQNLQIARKKLETIKAKSVRWALEVDPLELI